MEEWYITDFITQEETDEKNKLEYVSDLKIQQDTFQYNEESLNNGIRDDEAKDVESQNVETQIDESQNVESQNVESQIDETQIDETQNDETQNNYTTELNNDEDTIDINNLQEEIEVISVVDDKKKKSKSKKNDKKKKTNLIGRKKVYTL